MARRRALNGAELASGRGRPASPLRQHPDQPLALPVAAGDLRRSDDAGFAPWAPARRRRVTRMDKILLLIPQRRNKSDELPDLLVAECGPRRHGGATRAVVDGEKCTARVRRLRPGRHCQVCRRRSHAFAAPASTVGANTVADGTIGGKQGATGRLGLARGQKARRCAWRPAVTSRNDE